MDTLDSPSGDRPPVRSVGENIFGFAFLFTISTKKGKPLTLHRVFYFPPIRDQFRRGVTRSNDNFHLALSVFWGKRGVMTTKRMMGVAGGLEVQGNFDG